ncbi:MAG: hypothetical protein E7031_00340 [Akkermansiaceae bacterium]|nr:hypothetical protein [Akkermansiaceae bacterium]
MKPVYLLTASVALLSSCSWLEGVFSAGEYTPEYLKEESPLDPPGTAEAREAARRKLVKEGMFVDGAEIEVREGKAFLFNRNPDHAEDPGGRMVKTEKAKILACEGSYYFVEVEGGKRGFLRESDFVDPVSMLTSTSDFLPDGQGLFPGMEPGDTGTFIPGAELQVDENQTYTTSQTGRTVLVVGTKSDKSKAFEEAKRQVESGQALPPTTSGSGVADEEFEPLPAPTGSAQ